MPIGHGPKRLASLRVLAFLLDLVTPTAIAYLFLTILIHSFPTTLPSYPVLFGNTNSYSKAQGQGDEREGNSTPNIPFQPQTPSSFSLSSLAWPVFLKVGLPVYCCVEFLFFLYFCWEHRRLQRTQPVKPMNQV